MSHSVVQIFGLVYYPIYRGLVNTGREYAETVSLSMTAEKAKAYVQQLEDEGCRVNLKVTPL